MNTSEAGGGLSLIQTLLLLSFKCGLVSKRTIWFTQKKQWGLFQNKVACSLAAIRRPGHWTDNYKIVYRVFKVSPYETYLSKSNTKSVFAPYVTTPTRTLLREIENFLIVISTKSRILLKFPLPCFSTLAEASTTNPRSTRAWQTAKII